MSDFTKQLITWAIDAVGVAATLAAVVVALWLTRRQEQKRVKILANPHYSSGDIFYPTMPQSAPARIEVDVTNVGSQDLSIRTLDLDLGIYRYRFAAVLSDSKTPNAAYRKIRSDLPVLVKPTEAVGFVFDIFTVTQSAPPNPPRLGLWQRPRIRAIVLLTTGETHSAFLDSAIVNRFANSQHWLRTTA